MPLRHRLGRWITRLDDVHSAGLQRWYRVSPFDRPWIIVPYLGFGTPHRLHVSGRVLREVHHREPDAADSAWRNAAEFWKRMESDELPGARVRATFRGATVDSIADNEGHFHLAIDVAEAIGSGWHAVELELVGRASGGETSVTTQAEVLVPALGAEFGIISDLDDTVVWSDVRRKLRMLAMLMRSNARMRKPFKGVAAFYRALHRGIGGIERNPLFYVSNSPWNLYAPLLDFLRLQGLPRGPLMLRDFGEHLLYAMGERGSHKRRCIEHVFATYPALSFVLIGDSGEQDPEIYGDLVKDHPSRVRAIYIRNVTPDPRRVEAIDKLAREVQRTGAQLVLTADSESAAVHAAASGLMAADALAEVRLDVRGDEGTAAR